MKSYLYHIQFNIDFSNKDFYKKLLKFLGWKVIAEMNDTLGFRSQTGADLWFVANDDKDVQDYKNSVVHHLAIRVDKQSEFSKLLEHLRENNIELYSGTSSSAFRGEEFIKELSTSGEEDLYEMAQFLSPDKIVFEVVYIGKED